MLRVSGEFNIELEGRLVSLTMCTYDYIYWVFITIKEICSSNFMGVEMTT